MKRRILAVTGSRAEYGSMRPVFRAIMDSRELELHLLVTGMHLVPRFRASLEEIEADAYGTRHMLAVFPEDGSAAAMSRALGRAVEGITDVLARVEPQIVLVQGDRGEMLAAAAAAAHLDIPVVHMSGGDRTGSIDDSIRNAITSFAHVHLTTCEQSSARLAAMGEASGRVFQVGEPTLDVILALEPMPWPALCGELDLIPDAPVVLATQHSVTTEAADAGRQVTETLAALEQIGLQTVFTYPNTDSGYEAIVDTLQSWQSRDWLRVVPHLGSLRYLSLMRGAALLVGNSSSGILEAASFAVPVINIGTRQHGRTRACNVIDAGYDRREIRAAMDRALGHAPFRSALADCRNPYGDGRCAERTVDILARLRLEPPITAKWLDRGEPVVR